MIWCCYSGFLQLLPERSSQYQNMVPSNIERESNRNLWKDEMNQKSFSSFFSEMTKSSLLLHSFSPHLINIPAWAQKMRILHVKPNFKENKSLRNFTIIKSQRTHKKTHKVSRLFAFPWDVGRNIYLIFVPALMQYCTLSITWKFLQFPTEKGSGCARLEAGVALQHTWLSSAWSVLRCWMRAKGQLSTCPVWDGAGSKAYKMTAHRRIPQPGTRTQATATGKTSRQLKKTWCITHVLLGKQQASNLPKQHNTLGVKLKQNNSAIQYMTLAVISLQSPTSSSNHSPLASLHCFMHWAQTVDRATLWYLYTGFKRLTKYRNWCTAKYIFFVALQIS